MLERFDKVIKTTPEQAAEIIIKAMLKGKARQLIGPDAYLVGIGSRLFPISSPRRLTRVAEKAA